MEGMTFKRFVKMKIAQKDTTQKEVAKQIGISDGNFNSTVFKNPSLSTINKVLTALGEDLVLANQFKIIG
jgi:DNA-binding phage protein